MTQTSPKASRANLQLTLRNRSNLTSLDCKYQLPEICRHLLPEFLFYSFNEFTDVMVEEVFNKKRSGMKDILLPLCKRQKAYLYHLDKDEHFWLRINHVNELFRAQ